MTLFGRRIDRATRFTQRSLALAQAPLPWHRGVVTVGGLVLAVGVGFAWQTPWSVVLALVFAFFLILSDIEGPLAMRLATLLWSTVLMAFGATLSIALSESPVAFAVVFVVLAYGVGLAAWAGSPIMGATRFGAITGLALQGVGGIDAGSALLLLVVMAVVIGLTRSLEAWIAPDAVAGDYSTLRVALFKLRAARPLLWRYALVYALVAALGWLLARSVDRVHPTWVAVTTLVTMWPDAVRSFERVLQRFFGTLAGALVTLLLHQVLTDPVVLGAVALGLAFFVPHCMRRNYWLYCALVVVLVLVTVDVSSKTGFTRHVVAERVGDVLLGCVFALVGTVFAFGRTHLRARRVQRPP